MRGFGSGLVWGGIFGAAGLVIVSELSPMPGQTEIDPAAVSEATAPAATEAEAPQTEAGETPAPETGPSEPAPAPGPSGDADLAPSTETAAAPADAPAASPEAEPEAAPAASEVEAPAGSEFLQPAPDSDPSAPAAAGGVTTGAAPAVQAPDTGTAPPAAETASGAAPQLDLAVPAAPVVPEAAPEAPVVAAMEPPAVAAEPAAGAPAAPTAEPAPSAADLPPPPPLTPEEEALVETAPEIIPEGEAAVLPTDPPIVPDTPLTEAAPEGDALPEAGFSGEVDGVTVGRLPRIGDPPADAAGVAVDPADMPPMQRYARAFENPEGKPVFAIVLIDDGAPDLDRAQLAALPFPVTFALDPAQPGVAERAASYLEAGQEVVMLASAIPAGATAADLEVTFSAHEEALPQAVAVLDLPDAGFQNDRPLASMVVPIVKGQGRGLLTFDRGLNPADQVASREGVPAATVFRVLDAEDEPTAAIRRYLDRAAFKAAQDGRVVVVGRARPETVAALMEWSVEGRAAGVVLAPVTAALSSGG